MDASPVGLGAILTQTTPEKDDKKVMAYASRSLTPVESRRIERWCLRLEEYSFHVKYRPGPKNPSDYLSRHPCTATNTRKPLENIDEEHVCLIAENAIPVAMDIACIKDATRQDPNLSKTIEFIQTNNWTALEKQDKMPT
ncbi:Hypothetical predicted protein [Paramuricea clavata]|uniref:Reverse transcriptase/retrotransposon-derived protein RNase H-like domain-containing protein n=1 Tax=Paramuricea clavata TaxID=317549 RepID=A0A6S7IN69_PARCT|nr:Hypothetical predicted protein [Paramuricea clavata]